MISEISPYRDRQQIQASSWLALGTGWLPDRQAAKLPDYYTKRQQDNQTARLPDCQTTRQPNNQTARLLLDCQTTRLPENQTARLPDCLTT
jgi:hypothetical protein